MICCFLSCWTSKPPLKVTGVKQKNHCKMFPNLRKQLHVSLWRFCSGFFSCYTESPSFLSADELMFSTGLITPVWEEVENYWKIKWLPKSAGCIFALLPAVCDSVLWIFMDVSPLSRSAAVVGRKKKRPVQNSVTCENRYFPGRPAWNKL